MATGAPPSASTGGGMQQAPNDIWLGRGDMAHAEEVVDRCVQQLQSLRSVAISATSFTIPLAIGIAEGVKRRVSGAHQVSELLLGKTPLVPPPPAGGSSAHSMPRDAPGLRITLSLEPADATSVKLTGYQAPVPTAEARPDADVSVFLLSEVIQGGAAVNDRAWEEHRDQRGGGGGGGAPGSLHRGGWRGGAPRQGHGEGRPQWGTDAAYRRRGGASNVGMGRSGGVRPPFPYQQQQQAQPQQQYYPSYPMQHQQQGLAQGPGEARFPQQQLQLHQPPLPFQGKYGPRGPSPQGYSGEQHPFKGGASGPGGRPAQGWGGDFRQQQHPQQQQPPMHVPQYPQQRMGYYPGGPQHPQQHAPAHAPAMYADGHTAAGGPAYAAEAPAENVRFGYPDPQLLQQQQQQWAGVPTGRSGRAPTPPLPQPQLQYGGAPSPQSPTSFEGGQEPGSDGGFYPVAPAPSGGFGGYGAQTYGGGRGGPQRFSGASGAASPVSAASPASFPGGFPTAGALSAQSSPMPPQHGTIGGFPVGVPPGAFPGGGTGPMDPNVAVNFSSQVALMQHMWAQQSGAAQQQQHGGMMLQRGRSTSSSSPPPQQQQMMMPGGYGPNPSMGQMPVPSAGGPGHQQPQSLGFGSMPPQGYVPQQQQWVGGYYGQQEGGGMMQQPQQQYYRGGGMPPPQQHAQQGYGGPGPHWNTGQSQ